MILNTMFGCPRDHCGDIVVDDTEEDETEGGQRVMAQGGSKAMGQEVRT